MRLLPALALAALLLLSMTGSAQARAGDMTDYIQQPDYVVDASVAFASGPAHYGSGSGITVGAGCPLPQIDANLEMRLDLAIYYFSSTFSWGKGSYLRLPATVSARYYLLLSRVARAFLQTGIETSIDSFDFEKNSRKYSRADINLGLTPAAGVELFMNPAAGFFVLARYHIIHDPYASMNIGVQVHF